jgi:hypothetical protein
MALYLHGEVILNVFTEPASASKCCYLDQRFIFFSLCICCFLLLTCFEIPNA